jgi:tRNA pseudouridine32 synthase/23S rRNA pseudouridine746 synthase
MVKRLQNSSPFYIHLVHSDFLVVEKPAGLNFHSEDGEVGFISQLKDWASSKSFGEIYSVHRLDKVTSGAIIVARTKEAASYFAKLFRDGGVGKYYLALSSKKPKKKQGTISGDMATSRRGAYKLLHSKNNPAITQFFSFGTDLGYRLFLIKILTGKTHQIRVALKSLGSPVTGDKLYGSSSDIEERCYLHSFLIKFTYKSEEFEVISYPFNPLFCEVISAVNGGVGFDPPSCYNWPKVKK